MRAPALSSPFLRPSEPHSLAAVPPLALRCADLVARGWPVAQEALTSSSRGLIGATTFGVLPNVTPRLTFALTLSLTGAFLAKLWFDPTFRRFLDSVVLAAMTSFLFGWHVHEKAVLLFLIPLRCVGPPLSHPHESTRSSSPEAHKSGARAV